MLIHSTNLAHEIDSQPPIQGGQFIAPELVSDTDEQPINLAVSTSSFNPLLVFARSSAAHIKSDISKEEFDRFVLTNTDLRIEKDKFGTITIHPPMTLDSGFFEEEVLYFLKHWSKNNPSIGKVFSPSTSYNLPDGSQFKADGAWISTEKLNTLSSIERKSIAAIVPDFVIETRSQTDNLTKLKKKMTDVWLANGVKLAWLFDPKSEKVWIYRQGVQQAEEITGFTGIITGEGVLVGFELDLSLLQSSKD